MKYSAEMALVGTIHIRIDSGIRKMLMGDTHREQDDLISLFSFLRNKKSRIITQR
jgi:hypothetical protein